MKSRSILNEYQFYIFLIILTGYYGFYRINAIPRDIRILSESGAIILIVFLLVVKKIYGNQKDIKKNFVLPINLFLISLFLSTVVTKTYHNQSVALSLWISRGLFYYLLYYLLHAYKFNREVIEKTIISIGLITIFLYYIQTAIYPTQIFDVRMSIDRGTLRLFLPTMGFTIVAYFYYLNRFFKTNSIGYAIVLLLALSIFILQATRQLIASLVLLAVINLFRSREVRSRFVIILLGLIGSFALFILFYDLFMEIFAVSENQIGDQEESVRSRAMSFFIKEFTPNTLAYILGNGEGHQASSYGLKLFSIQISKGFYLSDIGIVGDYFRYGILFVLGALIMIFRFLSIKVPENYEHLRYYIYLSLFTLFTSRGIFGTPNIIIILIAYLFDLGNKELKMNKKI